MTRIRRSAPSLFAVLALAALAGCAGGSSTSGFAFNGHPVADDCIGCWNNR
ncbi:MAG: hypothetical protein AAFN79_05395 [Pseudomonadota bacterium]